MTSTDVLIVGAGISGLLLATRLKSKNILLEKSRGIGGRIATRRVNDLGFDHGAPFLIDDSLLRETLVEFNLENEMRLNPQGIYFENSMTRFPKKLIDGLEIHKSTRAEIISKSGLGWTITCDNGETFEAKKIVVTAPLPQALELLDKNNLPYSPELKSISYLKAVMALIVTSDGALPDLSPSSFIHSILPMNSRNLHPKGFVARASSLDSERLFDLDDETILKEIETHFKNAFSREPNIEYSELKKWRYVTPTAALPYPYLEVQENFFLIGDAFQHSDARGSLLGALLLAEKLN